MTGKDYDWLSKGCPYMRAGCNNVQRYIGDGGTSCEARGRTIQRGIPPLSYDTTDQRVLGTQKLLQLLPIVIRTQFHVCLKQEAWTPAQTQVASPTCVQDNMHDPRTLCAWQSNPFTNMRTTPFSPFVPSFACRRQLGHGVEQPCAQCVRVGGGKPAMTFKPVRTPLVAVPAPSTHPPHPPIPGPPDHTGPLTVESR